MARRGRTINVLCDCGCGVRFDARVADRNRGWGRFATKRCKAREQEQRTGQYAELLSGGNRSFLSNQIATKIRNEFVEGDDEVFSGQFEN